MKGAKNCLLNGSTASKEAKIQYIFTVRKVKVITCLSSRFFLIHILHFSNMLS